MNKHVFVMPNVCHDKHNFVTTKVLLQQAYFCRNKRRVLLGQTHVCPDKDVFVMTKLVTTKMKLVTVPASDSVIALFKSQ